ncbi:MAG: carboxypeptidase M32 [Pirellula sp.]|jgi:carboxypeptidase Taq|nr:carboxypeptidase M32 [Pirellula sp.]
MTDQREILDKAYSHARRANLVATTMALLEWDQHTYMPSLAGEYRSDQVTWLSEELHRLQTNPQYGEWLDALQSSEFAIDPNSAHAANIRGLLRDYRKNVQLPERLVSALARATSRGQQVWVEARSKNDFGMFLPLLDEIVRLRVEEATILQQPGRTKYDSLLDQYEEGADSNEIAAVFHSLQQDLVPIVQQAGDRERAHSKKIRFATPLGIDSQRSLSQLVAEQIGFDFQRGRLDETAHPFCTSLGPHDHRILTRYLTDSYSSGMYGVLHEAGHGMYEQALPVEHFGLPAGSAASLGVHESQSRLWENMVGRSAGFWKWLLPLAKSLIPELANVSLDQVVADVNRVEPSLIRVEADEATYNLHIFIRFELEKELVDGDLKPKSLPDRWHSLYQDRLGIRSPDDADGVLQDVHWSAGLIGYFPTYALGNLYAAQLFQTADRDLGNLEQQFEAGEFQPLLDWLRTNIHSKGRCQLPHLLIQGVTGQRLNAQPFLSYLRGKLLP